MANGESDILDGVNDIWLSGNVTYDSVRVGDTGMVGVVLEPDSVDGWSNTTYEFVLLPVYRNVTTDSYYDEAQGMNVPRTRENVINHYGSNQNTNPNPSPTGNGPTGLGFGLCWFA